LVDVGSWILSAAYWKVASGDFDHALKLQKVIPVIKFSNCQAGGGIIFVVGLLGWYMTFVFPMLLY